MISLARFHWHDYASKNIYWTTMQIMSIPEIRELCHITNGITLVTRSDFNSKITGIVNIQISKESKGR